MNTTPKAESQVTAPRTTGKTIPFARLYELLLGALSGGRDGELRALILDQVKPLPGEQLLDVGCGPGHLAFAAMERVQPDGQVTGIDASAAMIARARAKAAGMSRAPVFTAGVIEQLQAADAAFDIVTSTFVMHHLPENLHGPAITEMVRVLRPGGRLLIADIQSSTPSSSLARIKDAFVLLHGGHKRMRHNVDRLKPLLESQGLSQLRSARLSSQVVALTAVKG